MAANMPTNEEARAKKLPAVKRRTINVSPEAMVRAGYLHAGQTLPLVLEPAVEGVNLIAWATGHRDSVEQQLLQYGAILFRNFAGITSNEFEQFCGALSRELLEYRERSSPRSRVSGRVYTSTDYPANQSIFPHNEHSYSLTFPLRLYFFCETPAAEGGETPIADTRKIFRRIDPQIRARFIEKKWMYVRNFGDGFGLSWQTVFQTTDKSVVEQYCRGANISVEWKEGDRLRTRQVRDAITTHPHTGEPVWFNHATFFHVSTLEPGIRRTLLVEFSEEDLPNNSYYGDGSPIEPEVLEHLRHAYAEESVSFPWQQGDILLIDNMLTAHARAPYTGARRILVTMADPFTRPDATPSLDY
jgi:alpha-ketoglutarate-dependent taurine dioxygenase